jgi:hypothetical protein
MFYDPVSRLSSSSLPPFDAFSTCGIQFASILLRTFALKFIKE